MVTIEQALAQCAAYEKLRDHIELGTTFVEMPNGNTSTESLAERNPELSVIRRWYRDEIKRRIDPPATNTRSEKRFHSRVYRILRVVAVTMGGAPTWNWLLNEIGIAEGVPDRWGVFPGGSPWRATTSAFRAARDRCGRRENGYAWVNLPPDQTDSRLALGVWRAEPIGGLYKTVWAVRPEIIMPDAETGMDYPGIADEEQRRIWEHELNDHTLLVLPRRRKGSV